jgi:replicative DNA helicase
MASLRSSGHIEQAADVIVSLWSKPGEQTDPTRAKVYMDILKNRNGYTAINGAREYALWFNKPTFTFHEIDTRRVG